jgi:hypothetical protein
LKALKRIRAFPSGVLGPVDFWAFRRIAARRAGVIVGLLRNGISWLLACGLLRLLPSGLGLGSNPAGFGGRENQARL